MPEPTLTFACDTGQEAERAVGEHTVIDVNEPRATVELEERIIDSALMLVARWGVSKSSLADIAKEAGCSRATVYRSFPGGKSQVFAAVATRELSGYMEAIVEVIDAADSLDEAVTSALVVSARLLRDHPAAQFVMAYEPDLLLPFLGFKRVDRLYDHVATSVSPHLERFVPAARAAWLAEWAARVFITYLFNPDSEVDLVVVADTRHLVQTYLLPAFTPVPVA